MDLVVCGTTGQFARIAFGATQAEADNNLTIVAGGATTGIPIPALVDSGDLDPIGVPNDAEFAAICNESSGDTQVITLVLGRD